MILLIRLTDWNGNLSNSAKGVVYSEWKPRQIILLPDIPQNDFYSPDYRKYLKIKYLKNQMKMIIIY